MDVFIRSQLDTEERFQKREERWKEMELEENQRRRATTPAADDTDAWGNDSQDHTHQHTASIMSKQSP